MPRPLCNNTARLCKYSQALLAIESLELSACWQPQPHMHAVVYSKHVPPPCCAGLGFCQMRPSPFQRRAARHFGPANIPCHFCTHGRITFHHVLLHCSAHNIMRERWHVQSTSQSLSLHSWLSTDPMLTTARQMVHNVAFVASICQARF